MQRNILPPTPTTQHLPGPVYIAAQDRTASAIEQEGGGNAQSLKSVGPAMPLSWFVDVIRPLHEMIVLELERCLSQNMSV